MKVALIVDPSLVSRTGHHYNATKALIAELKKQGWLARILISSRADPEILNELGAIGCFPKRTYDYEGWTQVQYNFEGEKFYKLLRAQLKRRKEFPEVIFFPTCDPIQLSSIARVIKKVKPQKTPRIAAWLLFPPRLDFPKETSSTCSQIEEFKNAFSKIRLVLQDDSALLLFSETTVLVETYKNLSGWPVQLLSLPNGLQRQTIMPATKTPKRAVHLVVVGNVSIHKGYGLLPTALRLIIDKHRGVRATIHGDIQLTGNPDALKQMMAIKDVSSRITTYLDPLSSEDYYKLLRSADLIVLPYDPVSYRDKGSGIFTEAAELGIPVVVPQLCKFSSAAIKEQRAIAIERYDAAALADAISLAIKQLGTLRANALSHAAKLSAEISSRDIITTILQSTTETDVVNKRVGMIEKLVQAAKNRYEKIFHY